MQMPVEAVFRDIQLAADKPLGERFVPLQYGLPFRMPHQEFRSLLSPELLRVLNRFAVEFLVFLEAGDVRFMREGFGRLENPAFNQVSFNMLGHATLRVSNSLRLRKTPPFA